MDTFPPHLTLLDQLHDFSEQFSAGQSENDESLRLLWMKLEEERKRLNFPAVKADVGALLSQIAQQFSIQTVFEFGSGYGHSAYWWLKGGANSIQKIILTERRTDLEEVFNKLPWPRSWKEKIQYHQDDAFQVIEDNNEIFDAVLLDGQKSHYRLMLEKILPRLSSNAHVVIDNVFWQGFVGKTKTSVQGIQELYQFVDETKSFRQKIFLPYRDGILWLSR